MELIQNTPEIAAYLAADEVIDHDHRQVRATAAALAAEATDAYTYAKAAFEFVRDTIPHSADSGDPRVTWRASDVLARRTGICYAKAHALVALLRARSIPAGLCYQKLDTVHGLVAVRLPGEDRWARQDPRGNKPGVDAQFRLDREQLAFPVRPECNELDYPVLFAEPHPTVLQCLQEAVDRPHLWQMLPTDL
ncbi:Transglutaminase-like superfamily protein [Streptomyces sp. 2224.1]|uniref:transglutaminase-like domain-containing protein n=1 Tax=unclassified Streptomyces TaxID=2593676 RepID=UPI000885C85F|nr:MULTISPECIES: transglutaminase family protein [unclassified Streptomyces]PBC81156.1 transglutaminase superfamily protein [Streptomyces sp. 2321.6]SDR56182.1 Transglutaminase-like superfamily protein [Streptomyces sp. KS_16]SEC03536.1 Transglutaminase-like superfamily protein [Streptomyces sp. 2133.1]SED24956.1 Transglutaminase-like superfamily protein [Streptomyces sp. 2224.1]SNC64000.1 Transglutaminase-like superfamily protein [Streptomyces sp. 2114.4]